MIPWCGLVGFSMRDADLSGYQAPSLFHFTSRLDTSKFLIVQIFFTLPFGAIDAILYLLAAIFIIIGIRYTYRLLSSPLPNTFPRPNLITVPSSNHHGCSHYQVCSRPFFCGIMLHHRSHLTIPMLLSHQTDINIVV